MDKKLFVFGLGYVGKHLKSQAEKLGYQVDGSHHNSIIQLQNLLKYENILITIPPIDGVDIVYRDYLEILQQSKNLKWLGYLSTTGVYGNVKDGFVNENHKCNPTGISSEIRYKIEQNWLSSDLPIHVFRLASIYGPERSVVSQLKAGMERIIYKKDHLFCRIHIDDIIDTLIASINNPNPRSIYNLADDLPANNVEIITYACGLLNIALPYIEDISQAEMSSRLKEFYLSMRRVSNDKIKKELGIKLKYPTYKSGLNNLVKIS